MISYPPLPIETNNKNALHFTISLIYFIVIMFFYFHFANFNFQHEVVVLRKETYAFIALLSQHLDNVFKVLKDYRIALINFR